MNVPPSPVLEFPAMLCGLTGTVRRRVSVQGQQWAREYLQTGGFTPPQRMLPVPPGEPILMHAGAEFEFISRPASWRVHLFHEVFMYLNDGIPEEAYPRARESFESFCLSTPWGTLAHAIEPPPPWSAERMAQRLAALLRFWDMLQGLRYGYRTFDTRMTLGGLVDYIYRPTLEAWCPGGPPSVREHLALTVERMSRATREECMEVVLRMIPALVDVDPLFKHPEVLKDPGFLRERLSALPSEDFGDFSGTYKYMVTQQLAHWERDLFPQEA